MLTLIAEGGHGPVKHAAVLLGIDPKTERLGHVLARRAATSAAERARVAGAIALGHAEERSYWSPHSPGVQGWVAILTEDRWDPDRWTGAHILAGTGQHGGGTIEPDHVEPTRTGLDPPMPTLAMTPPDRMGVVPGPAARGNRARAAAGRAQPGGTADARRKLPWPACGRVP